MGRNTLKKKKNKDKEQEDKVCKHLFWGKIFDDYDDLKGWYCIRCGDRKLK
tara:strand:- start:7892 stop:8044 length:153 start_codon:yes stop_codon:yes gene_type:complete